MTKIFIPHYINIIIDILFGQLWKLINYMSAKWWRVKIGKNCKFKGKTIFRPLSPDAIIIGKNCIFNSNHRSNLIGIYSPCILSTIKSHATIVIGENCGFSGTVIASAISIKLGNNIKCGANTLITDSDWHSDDYRSGLDKEIIIEDNVWLGYGVKILKGVHIGKNSMIGAGSIVTHNIPANVIAAGNPCKVIRNL